MILFDANVLVHAHAMQSPYYEAARQLRDQAVTGVIAGCLSPQVLCEFFAVVTNERLFRPALTAQQAGYEVAKYWASQFRKIVPTETTLLRAMRLAQRHGLLRQGIFDTFLVATMLDNEVQTIYTQNVKDFAIYPDLQVINPFPTPASSLGRFPA